MEEMSEVYTSLDDEEQYQAAIKDPKAFILALQKKGTAIDECQLAERIFPALKRESKKRQAPWAVLSFWLRKIHKQKTDSGISHWPYHEFRVTPTHTFRVG